MKIILQHSNPLNDSVLEYLLPEFITQVKRLNTNAFVLTHVGFNDANLQELSQKAHAMKIDMTCLEQDLNWSDFKILAMDMDSTVINIECIDEIADMCGKKAEVATITEAAMRGEITDFNHSLRLRLAILAGVDATILQRVLDERLQLNPGAEQLIQTAHKKGLQTLLVSGGFTFFTQALQKRLDLTHTRANQLEIVSGKITGQVIGEIVNGEVKAKTVRAYCDKLGVPTSATICMGDGANDLPMMAISGLSVAYHAKPRVQKAATIAFNHIGLDGLITLFNAN